MAYPLDLRNPFCGYWWSDPVPRHCVSVDVSASSYGRVVKLPVDDRQDIRFVRFRLMEVRFKAEMESIAAGQLMDSFGWPATDYIATTDTAFSPYRHEPGDPNSPERRFHPGCFERSGPAFSGSALLLEGSTGWTPRSGSVTHYRHEPEMRRSLSNNSVACLYQDRSGHLWIGTKRRARPAGSGDGSLHPLRAQSPGCRQPEQQ